MHKYSKFKGYIAEHGIRHKEIADVLGCSTAKVTAILSKNNVNNQDFRVKDVIAIANHFNLSDEEMMSMFINREHQPEKKLELA